MEQKEAIHVIRNTSLAASFRCSIAFCAGLVQGQNSGRCSILILPNQPQNKNSSRLALLFVLSKLTTVCTGRHGSIYARLCVRCRIERAPLRRNHNLGSCMESVARRRPKCTLPVYKFGPFGTTIAMVMSSNVHFPMSDLWVSGVPSAEHSIRKFLFGGVQGLRQKEPDREGPVWCHEGS